MIAAMAACVMTLTGALAQEQTQKTQLPRQRPTPEQIAQKRTEMMTKRLDLDEAQTQKVYQVNLENAKLMEKHRVQMKAERQNEAEQMKGILTTDQFVKWSQLQASPQGVLPGKQGVPDDDARLLGPQRRTAQERKIGRFGRNRRGVGGRLTPFFCRFAGREAAFGRKNAKFASATAAQCEPAPQARTIFAGRRMPPRSVPKRKI